MIYQFEHPLASQPVSQSSSQAAGADLESFPPPAPCHVSLNFCFISNAIACSTLCVCLCVSGCLCVCMWQGGEQGAGLLMGDRGGICVFLARANAHASKQAGETGIDRGGIEGTARTHYECGSRQRKQRQSEARKQQRQTQTLRQRQRQTQTEAA